MRIAGAPGPAGSVGGMLLFHNRLKNVTQFTLCSGIFVSDKFSEGAYSLVHKWQKRIKKLAKPCR